MPCCSCCARSACSASSATRARPSCRCSSISRPTSTTSSACRSRSWSAWPTATRTATRQRRLRQPALGGRRRPRDGRDLHRVEEPHAARHHRRPAGALAVPVRPVPVLGAGDRAAQALRQVELRAGAGRGRAAGDRPRLLPRDAAAARSGAGLDPVRRLGPRLCAGRAAARQPRSRAATPAVLDAIGAALDASERPGVRRRCRRRPRRRLGRSPGPGRAPSGARLHGADVGALRLRRRPSAVRRLPAGDARADRRRPRRQRPGAGARCARLHLSRRRPRAACAGRRRALSDHRRSRHRRARAGRHLRRGRPARRGADAAAAGRRRASGPRRRVGRRGRARSVDADVGGLCLADPGRAFAIPTTSSSKRRRARAR